MPIPLTSLEEKKFIPFISLFLLFFNSKNTIQIQISCRSPIFPANLPPKRRIFTPPFRIM
ncbi:MAG: hypothetical protein A3G93_03515 [Nitrospinae bacterium RIFCSPLOWO2_12_FULL_45_22]|nr:MAG: hypothetical protein A3G93_03515 [Nitrospinae bacterium RIFCSPLOWO2_12_FULL_45_22]